MKPKISVVIPTYNCLELLPRAIESVNSQQLTDLEIIVVDDNSSDGTWAWLEKAQLSMPFLRISKTEGVGPARARNQAIACAEGEYIAFLDADDYWLEGKLKAQLEFHLNAPEVVLSFTNYRRVSWEGVELGERFLVWSRFGRQAGKATAYTLLGDAQAVIYAENAIATSTVMVTKRALEKAGYFDESLESAEDWELWLRICKVGSIAFTPEEGMVYMVGRPGSEGTKLGLRLKYIKQIMRAYRGDVFPNNKRAVRVAYGALAFATAELHGNNGRYFRAGAWELLAAVLLPSMRRLREALIYAARGFGWRRKGRKPF